MCFFFSLIPATVMAAFGYFVLYASARAEGGVQWFGRGLATWIFLLALMFPIMGAYVATTGLCPLERMMEQVKAQPTSD